MRLMCRKWLQRPRTAAWGRCAAQVQSCQGWFSLLVGLGDLLVIMDGNQINKTLLNMKSKKTNYVFKYWNNRFGLKIAA